MIGGHGRTRSTGDPRPSRNRIDFRFGGPDRRIVVDVLSTAPDTQVVWRCVEGSFSRVDGRRRSPSTSRGLRRRAPVLRFAHARLRREPVEFMAHCSTKWASSFAGLKAGFEGGQGSPIPRRRAHGTWARLDPSRRRPPPQEMNDIFERWPAAGRCRQPEHQQRQTLRRALRGLDMARQSAGESTSPLLEARGRPDDPCGRVGRSSTTSTPPPSTSSLNAGSTTTTNPGSTRCRT